MNTMHNDEEMVERLSGEIRDLGEPYASPEPDSLYWANFRVRVMSEVERKQARGLIGWLKQSLSPSPVRWIGAVSAIGAIAVSVVLLQPTEVKHVQEMATVQTMPSGQTPSAQTVPQRTGVSEPVASTSTEIKPLLPVVHQRSSGRVASAPMAVNRADTDSSFAAVISGMDLSDVDLFGTASPLAETETATPLEELSAPELESVLVVLQEH